MEGIVFQVVHKKTGQVFAMKAISYDGDEDKAKMILASYEPVKGLEHPNLV